MQAQRYSGWGLPNAEPSTFTTLDNAHHAARIRQVNSLYQMSALVNIEYQIDGATNDFVERLTKYAEERKVIDMSDWLKYFAFDAVGSLSVSSLFITSIATMVTDQLCSVWQALWLYPERNRHCGNPRNHPLLCVLRYGCRYIPRVAPYHIQDLAMASPQGTRRRYSTHHAICRPDNQ